MTKDDIIDMALEGKQNLRDRIAYAIALEREACARLLELTDLSGLKDFPEMQIGIANILVTYTRAIRARGQHD